MNTLSTAATCTAVADAALACSVVAGEPGAFERLMRQYNRRLLRVARSNQREAAEAAEETEAQTAREPSAYEDEVPVHEASLSGTTAAGVPYLEPTTQPTDDLTRIHAIDADLRERLARHVVTRFWQIAAWLPDDVRAASQSLGIDTARIELENWIEQARILAAGGDPGTLSQREPAPAGVTAPVDGDRLHRIIGIDPDSEALLRANGVTRIADIAAWTAEDVAHFDALIGTPGRIATEDWVGQARLLAGLGSSHDFTQASAEDVTAEEPTGEDAATPETAVEHSPEGSEPSGEDLSGLRSVRSEALRGGAPLVFSTTEIDDLKRIRGIGVLIEKKLNSLGITSYEQVANWTGEDIERISEMLDFKGRIERENWIEQARILASGGQTEFSRRVDRGEA